MNHMKMHQMQDNVALQRNLAGPQDHQYKAQLEVRIWFVLFFLFLGRGNYFTSELLFIQNHSPIL